MPSETRKKRRSFTLSQDSVDYLERERKQRKAPSTSSVLDAILRERQWESEQQKLEARITSYYDSITDQQRAENRTWGAFGESHIAKE